MQVIIVFYQKAWSTRMWINLARNARGIYPCCSRSESSQCLSQYSTFRTWESIPRSRTKTHGYPSSKHVCVLARFISRAYGDTANLVDSAPKVPSQILNIPGANLPYVAGAGLESDSVTEGRSRQEKLQQAGFGRRWLTF